MKKWFVGTVVANSQELGTFLVGFANKNKLKPGEISVIRFCDSERLEIMYYARKKIKLADRRSRQEADKM